MSAAERAEERRRALASRRRQRPSAPGNASDGTVAAARAEWEREHEEQLKKDSQNVRTRADLQEYEKKLEDQNEAALDRALMTAADTEKTGAATLGQLVSQREALQRIDASLNEINHTMSRSERLLRGIKSIGGAIANAFTSPSKEPDRTMPAPVAVAPVSSSSSSSSSARAESRSSAATATNATKSGEQPQQVQKEKSRVDQQLEQLSGVMGTLLQQAQAMQGEIKAQDPLIGHIDESVDRTIHRIDKSNRTITGILRS